MPVTQLFMSYSRKDQGVAERLSAALKRAGAEIWIDHERLVAGTTDWENAVREGIKQADAVIYVASPDAAQSPYVRDELAIASKQNKQIFPFWATGDDWHDCAPIGFGSRQYVDGRGNKLDMGVRELIRALNAHGVVTREPLRPPATGQWDFLQSFPHMPSKPKIKDIPGFGWTGQVSGRDDKGVFFLYVYFFIESSPSTRHLLRITTDAAHAGTVNIRMWMDDVGLWPMHQEEGETKTHKFTANSMTFELTLRATKDHELEVARMVITRYA